MTARTPNTSRPTILLAALAIAVVMGIASVAVVQLLRSDRPEQTRVVTAGDDGVIGDPYPPPAEPTTTPSPAPDAQGVLPPPEGVVTDTTTIGASPWSNILTQIESAFDAQDSTLLASYLYEYEWEATRVVAEGSGTELTPSDAEAVFEQLFQNGSSPRMQGYFASFLGDECIRLVTSGWVGPVDLPTPAAPSATVTPPRPLMDAPKPPPEALHGDAFVWQVCDWGNGIPMIDYWHDGHFHSLVETSYGSILRGPDPAWFKYTIITP